MKKSAFYPFLVLIGCCFLAVFPAAQASEIARSFQCDLLNAKQLKNINLSDIYYRQLSNGLKVYILENHQLPVFALRIVFAVGAADERKGEGGYAHLFEHMMFKGSKNVPDGGHFSAVQQVGGQLNATTDYDKTQYWTEAPVQFLDRVLWLEAERMQNLLINQVNLDNQRQAVREEKLLRLDNVPYVKTAAEFMVSAWQGTDYDHLIIGTDAEIKNASVAQIETFFNQYYRPDNAIMVLVGDVNTPQVVAKIEAYFSAVNKPLINKRPVVVLPKKILQQLPGKSESRFDPLAPFPLYALGWHTPGKMNADFYAVELLADILLNHDTARLKQRLKEDQPLLFATIGMPLTFEQRGITAMGMVPHSYADFKQIQAIVKDEIQQIVRHGVSHKELCSAKKHRQLMILEKLASNRQLAGLIGDGALFFNDPAQAIVALDAYAAVNNAQIMQVAEQYFNNDWLALEIVPGPGIRFIKWLMEILPRGVSESIEQQFL